MNYEHFDGCSIDTSKLFILLKIVSRKLRSDRILHTKITDQELQPDRERNWGAFRAINIFISLCPGWIRKGLLC